MHLKKLFDLVNEVSNHSNYWFVRTDSGIYFDTYLKHNFIGIGWNKITVEDLTKSDVFVKEKIARLEKLDMGVSKSKGKATAIYHKMLRFKELKKGDRIIIPSNSSELFAFGIIADNQIHVDSDQSHNCEYYKRRKVKWGAVKNIKDLDATFYQIKVSRHAISDVKSYSPFIDKVIDSLYLKNGKSHFILEIQKRDDINLKLLTNFVTSISILTEKINDYFTLDENPDSSSIKLNLQSPGNIEIILERGKSLIIMAAILSIIACNDNHDHLNIPDTEKKELSDFMNVNVQDIDSIRNSMEVLEVNKERINSIH